MGGQIAGGGGTATITMTTFAPDTPGTYTNQAIVDPENTIPEGDEFNNQASVQTIVQNGGNGAFNDLHDRQDGHRDHDPRRRHQLHAAGLATRAPTPAANVAVRDILPAGTTFVSAEDNVPAAPAPSPARTRAASSTAPAPRSSPGSATPRFILIEVTAPNTNVSLTNQAFVDPDNAIPEGDELNNTDTHDTTVQSVINLKITKDGPDTRQPERRSSDYVITVTNEKPTTPGATGQTAFGVAVHDPLPVGLIPLAVNAGDGNNWACQILRRTPSTWWTASAT